MKRKNFSWPVTAMDREDYEAFFLWFDRYEQQLKTHQLVIWGAGIRGTGFSILLRERGYQDFLFVDSNPEKWGGCIDDFNIISPEQLEAERDRTNRIILISVENSAAIEKYLLERKYRRDIDYFLAKTDQYESYINEFLRPYEQDTLIMGDCEFSTMSLKDKDRDSLKDKLFIRCGRNTTKILAMHGIGLRAEYHIFQAQILNGMKPTCFILMVNLDTLTGKQHLLPRSQHVELLKGLLNVQKNPSDSFKEYIQIAEQRSKNLTAGLELGDLLLGGAHGGKY